MLYAGFGCQLNMSLPRGFSPSFFPAAAQMLAQSVSEVESFLNNFVNAFRNVGAPSCLTLLVGDGAGNVVSEKYFAT